MFSKLLDIAIVSRETINYSCSPFSFVVSSLGKKCFVFCKKTLAFLNPRILLFLDPRVKKSRCFSSKNKPFLAQK
jgi:hypothetical protein